MSSSGSALFRWDGTALLPLDHCDPSESVVLAADSWLVSDGTALALELHRERFAAAALAQLGASAATELESFWHAALGATPRDGLWFPRVELQRHRSALRLIARRRPAPRLGKSVVLATHDGPDPRTQPLTKGPNTEELLQARTAAQQRGAEEAVLLTAEGFIAEGAYSAIGWWKADAFCIPAAGIPRVDSVTAKSVVALAAALGVEVRHEWARPSDLDGLEIWAMSALHGIRIVTSWVDGPAPAAEPGRLALWRSRLQRLRKPLPLTFTG